MFLQLVATARIMYLVTVSIPCGIILVTNFSLIALPNKWSKCYVTEIVPYGNVRNFDGIGKTFVPKFGNPWQLMVILHITVPLLSDTVDLPYY